MAEEDFLQQFYRDHVFVQGDEGDEGWRTQRSYYVVKKTVKTLIEWLYQSSTGLYPHDPIDTGSYSQGLHLQSFAITSDLDFLLPLRYNFTLQLEGRMDDFRMESSEAKWLPTYIEEKKGGVPVFRSGSKFVLHLDSLNVHNAKPYCDNPSPHRCNMNEREKFKESLENHHLDPVCVLTDLYTYVHNALTAGENNHPRENDLEYQGLMCKRPLPQISKALKGASEGRAKKWPEKVDPFSAESLTVGKIKLLPWKQESPSVQLIFQLSNKEDVSVDLVPAIHEKVMLSEHWLRDDMAKLSDWWDKKPGNQERIHQKEMTVPKVKADIVAKHGFWRFSFANVETALLRDIDCGGGQRREALRLLKFINNEYLVPEYGKLLTSYHLKTVLLWALEIYSVKEWATLQSSLRNLVSVLRHCVEKGELPHYFLRGFNLFNKRYKEGDGFYERLARQILTKELALMELDRVQYISLRFPTKVSEDPEAFRRAATSLQMFKLSHQKALRELKRLDHGREYELEEKQPGDRNVSHPAGRQQDQNHLNFHAISAEMKQCPGPSPHCQGEAKESVSAASEQVTFCPDLDQERQNLLPLEILAPRQGPVQMAEWFATVDVMSEDYPGFKKDPSETAHLVLSQSLAQKREDLTLDPNTAHPLLEISQDRKEVSCGSIPRKVPADPRRFDTANCVVAEQSFRAGQHYWDVFVGPKWRWNLGIVSQLAERQGRLIWRKYWLPWFGEVCTKGYWLIGYNQQKAEKPYWAFDTNPMPFDCSHRPQTIRVCLDYEAGVVSFYGADDPDNLIPLYSFYHAEFKGAPVYPLFDPCWHDKGDNTDPLKIL